MDQHLAKMDTFENLFKFSSKSSRKNDLFNTTFTEIMKKKVKNTFNVSRLNIDHFHNIISCTNMQQNVDNVYNLYSPYLERLFEDAYRGRISPEHYSCTDPHANLDTRYQNVIIYILGGVTYIESRIVEQLRQKYPDVGIFLGGSHILNSKS